MEKPEQYYKIPKTLDKGRIFMGFPATESVPPVVALALLAWIGHEMIGLIIAFAVFKGMRILNGKFGQNILLLTFYAYSPRSIIKSFFRRLPASSKRYWRN